MERRRVPASCRLHSTTVRPIIVRRNSRSSLRETGRQSRAVPSRWPLSRAGTWVSCRCRASTIRAERFLSRRWKRPRSILLDTCTAPAESIGWQAFFPNSVRTWTRSASSMLRRLRRSFGLSVWVTSSNMSELETRPFSSRIMCERARETLRNCCRLRMPTVHRGRKTGGYTSTRMSRRKRDPSGLHHRMAGAGAMERGFPGRAGPDHLAPVLKWTRNWTILLNEDNSRGKGSRCGCLSAKPRDN